MTKITIENQYGTYSVESKQDDMALYDLMEAVIIPLLVATGYSEKLVWDMIGPTGIEQQLRKSDV